VFPLRRRGDADADEDFVKTKPCPKCGKPMREWPAFPGLWVCPDYERPTNTVPPFQFKCTGMELNKRGEAELQRELERAWAIRKKTLTPHPESVSQCG